jgi:hypothetical protein
MKKFALILFTAAVIPALSAGYFDDKGWISGWKFAPLQIDLSLVKHHKLVDESSNTLFSFGLFLIEQKSAVFSSALVANSLYNNYGLQINPLFMGTVTDKNYGISIGFENYSKRCYGIQLGVLNHSWAGEEIEKERERLQIFGINIADTVYCGLVNISNKVQIGIFNASPGGAFQIGLLNYNLKSYIPFLPFINWDMGRSNNTGK